MSNRYWGILPYEARYAAERDVTEDIWEARRRADRDWLRDRECVDAAVSKGVRITKIRKEGAK